MLMKNFVRRGILGLVFAVVTAAANAQGQLKVTPSEPVPGQAVTIEYSNPAMAGMTITVDIDDGGCPPCTDHVNILLNAAGKGSVNWIVPNWSCASFNAPGAREVTIFIDGGGAPSSAFSGELGGRFCRLLPEAGPTPFDA
jgi:hypothetical protein